MKKIVYVSSPKNKKIHVWEINKQGKLKLLQIMSTPGHVHPMAIHPENTHLYVGIRPIFGVISYSIDEQGLITEAGIASLPGSPTQLTTDLKGSFLYSASYSNSCLSVSPINKHNIVGTPQQHLKGLIHCHSVNIDTTNQVLWAPCLHEDRIRLYTINESGFLKPFDPIALYSSAGSGPRHMAFHHNGNYAYSINELSGTIDVISIDLTRTNLLIVQTVDIMPVSFCGTPWGAEICITPDGRWLYCSDRSASIISQFSVSEDGGALSLLGHQKTESQPRGFSIDAQGHFLIVAGEKSHHISVYAINSISGDLLQVGRYAAGEGPVWVSILTK